MYSLPINLKPDVRTYTYHLFVNSIISANCGDTGLLAKIKFNFLKNVKWFEYKFSATWFKYNNNFLEFHANKFDTNKRAFLYRKFIADDELVIEVSEHAYVSDWSTVNLFVCEKNELNDFSTTYCRVGMFSNNILCYDSIDKKSEPQYFINEYNARRPYYLKIINIGNNITGSISTDGIRWRELCSCCVSHIKNKVIGIEFNFGDNIYHNWLYSSYINFILNKDNPTHIDYLYAPMRDYHYNTFNPLIRYIVEKQYLILQQFNSIVEFIKFNIIHNRYVELYFDEYYIPNRKTSGTKHFLHGNLAYGFDDSNVFFLGIFEGKPIDFTLPFDNVIQGSKSALDIDRRNSITIYEFAPEDYKFNVAFFYRSLKNYLLGKIDNIEYYNINIEGCTFNINALDALTDEKGLDIFVNDIRISFLLREHTHLMQQRVNFLNSKDIFDNPKFNQISEMLTNLCNNSLVLQNLVIKYSFVKNDELKSKIFILIKKFKNDQISCYSQILKSLEIYLANDRMD